MAKKKTDEENQNVEPQRVADSEGQTAPVTQSQREVNQRSEAQQERAQRASGATRVKYVGRASGYVLDGERYEADEVYEVDEDTANRLLSAKDSRANNVFVQAD